MSPIIARTFCPGASPVPAGAASTVPAASMPGTRGKLTPTLRPSRSLSSERLRPNASTRMRTHPSRSGGSGRVVNRRLSTGPGPESRTARMLVDEDVTARDPPGVAELVRLPQRAAAAASFPNQVVWHRGHVVGLSPATSTDNQELSTGWMSWLSFVDRVALGVVWIWAAVIKMSDPDVFVRAIRAYRLIPEVFVVP